MTALLRPDETLTLGFNVIIRPGGRDPHIEWEAESYEVEFVAPQEWVALTGPCPTCGGFNKIRTASGLAVCPNRDCRDGRRIVPLYRECPHIAGNADHANYGCMTCDSTNRVLVGRGSIEVVPVVTFEEASYPCVMLIGSTGAVLIASPDAMAQPLALNSLPVPGRDFGIVIDVTELVS